MCKNSSGHQQIAFDYTLWNCYHLLIVLLAKHSHLIASLVLVMGSCSYILESVSSQGRVPGAVLSRANLFDVVIDSSPLLSCQDWGHTA